MTSNTSWKLYSDNDEAWYSMLTDCAHAEKSIVLEQFIFVNDDFGQKLINICAERAAAGVKVRFLWDAAGSFTIWGSNITEELRKKGIELLFWKTLIPGYFKIPNMRSWYLRNHRRTLVIDEKIGYTGSICVDDRLKNWRDTNTRLEGLVVSQMSNAFERMWARASHTKLPRPKHYQNGEFRYSTNFPAPGRRHIYSAVIKAIRKAQKNVYITTPYFVPTHRLLRTIKSSAKRGVDVRLLIPERSDHYALDLGAKAFFNTLLESGVRIFLYSGNMIHSKTIAIDDRWATVGSMNLDSASMLYNFEANIISTDIDFTKEITKHFQIDLTMSKEVSLSERKNRIFLEKIPEILIRLVKRFL